MTTVEIDEARVAQLADAVFANRDVTLAEAKVIAREAVTSEAFDAYIQETMDLANAEMAQEKLDAQIQGRIFYGEATAEDEAWATARDVALAEQRGTSEFEAQQERADWAKRVADAEKAARKFDPSTMARP